LERHFYKYKSSKNGEKEEIGRLQTLISPAPSTCFTPNFDMFYLKLFQNFTYAIKKA